MATVQPVGSLLRRALTLPQLRSAFERVSRNEGGPGVDGETVDQFGVRLEEKLRTLRAEVIADRYAPQPLLRLWLSRIGRKPRALAVPAVRDRVLQTSVAQVLNPLFEAEFEDCSFAYRQGRSVRQAVERIAVLQRAGYRWVVDADIEAFFDRIPHEPMLREVARLVVEPRLVELIRTWLSTDVVVDGRREPSTAGVPQGSPLSPMLANLYLDHLDETLLDKNLMLVRYADDCAPRRRVEVSSMIT